MEERSHSVAVVDTFLKAWKDANPSAEITIKNLFDEDLPTFDDPRLVASTTSCTAATILVRSARPESGSRT